MFSTTVSVLRAACHATCSILVVELCPSYTFGEIMNILDSTAHYDLAGNTNESQKFSRYIEWFYRDDTSRH